jgi:hypothetical protein
MMREPGIKSVMGLTTKIRVLDERWHVPRGFGAAYQRVLRDHFSQLSAGEPSKFISKVIDLLGLVGYEASLEQVSSWDLRRRVEAVVYAGTEHARASDNSVRRHPRPRWLPERAWQGADQGAGAFSGPRGTPIVEGV